MTRNAQTADLSVDLERIVGNPETGWLRRKLTGNAHIADLTLGGENPADYDRKTPFPTLTGIRSTAEAREVNNLRFPP
ncbi:MAG TPA: hypothetical protein VF283_17800 [Bryobacteraceae bacterium]